MATGVFNMNIENYTFNDLLGMLSVELTPDSKYDDIIKQIDKSVDAYVKIFQGLNKPEMVEFFNQVKNKLIGNNKLSTTSQNVLTYKNLYNPIGENFITQGEETYNQNSGAGNAINRKTVTKLLNIDSRFRSNYEISTSTNYLMDMPYTINNAIEMTLCDLELPSTSYPLAVSYQNNYFWIRTVDVSDIENFYYIVLPEGNYYYQTILSDINLIFNELSLNLSIVVDLDYNNIGGIGEGTGLTTIGVITQANIDNNIGYNAITTFELNFNGQFLPDQHISQNYTNQTINGADVKEFYYTPSSIDYKQLFGWIIGYRKALYTKAIATSESTIFYKSESIIDLSGPKYLFLIVDDFNKSVNVNFLTLSTRGMLKDNIIARISQKGQCFSIQSQNDFSVYAETRYYYGPVNISKLNIKIIDEFGRPLDLHSKDFSFTLRITTLYSIA